MAASLPVPATTSRSGVSVKLVRSAHEFAELHSSWNEVVSECVGRSVFLTHEWFDAAWKWRQATSELYLLCSYRSHRLIAVLPLVAETTNVRGVSIRELALLTVPDTQWCDLIVAGSDAEDVAAAIVAELCARQQEWDVLRLKYLGASSVAASSLSAALSQARFTVRHVEAPGNCYVALDGSWAEFYATRSRRLKKANNLAVNRLQRAGNVRVEWHAPALPGGSSIDDVVTRTTSVSAVSWKSRTTNSLDNVGPQAFIRRLSDLATARGWLSVWLLSLDGKTAAMEYQLVADGDVFGLRSDFDSALAEFSPGSSLNRHMLEQLFGRGLHRYYMGPGNNAYKHRWTDEVEPVREVTVYGRSLRGRLLAAWETALKPAASRLRDHFPRTRHETDGRKND